MKINIDLSDETLEKAQVQADKNKRSRKAELESILEETLN